MVISSGEEEAQSVLARSATLDVVSDFFNGSLLRASDREQNRSSAARAQHLAHSTSQPLGQSKTRMGNRACQKGLA